jgi:hypothetical protein
MVRLTRDDTPGARSELKTPNADCATSRSPLATEDCERWQVSRRPAGRR